MCDTCGRWRLRKELCWFCSPALPARCGCDDLRVWHRHLQHTLLERLSQLDYEGIDEAILLPTANWPQAAEDVLAYEHEEVVGITNLASGDPGPTAYRPIRLSWREAPEYRAFLARYPELRRRAHSIDAIFAYFGLTNPEADAWALDAAGYTPEWIAAQLEIKPGGVLARLASVRSKVAAKLAREDALSQRAV